MHRLWLPRIVAVACSMSSVPGSRHAVVSAQTLTPATRLARAVSADVFRGHLEYLSDDLLEGRAPATRGGELAAKYVAAQFRRLGLEPAGDSGTYFHRVPVITHTPDPTLRVTGADPTTPRYRADYVLWSMRNEEQVTLAAPAVFVGLRHRRPGVGLGRLRRAGREGQGRLLPGQRPRTARLQASSAGKILTYYGRWTYKIEEAQRQGAAGIVLIHTDGKRHLPLDDGDRLLDRRAGAPGARRLPRWWSRAGYGTKSLARLLQAGGLEPAEP